MESQRFDDLTRILTSIPSRRAVVRALAGMGFGLGVLNWRDSAEAKQKHKKHKQRKKHKRPSRQPQARPPLVVDQYGCIEVGQPCQGDSTLCCSGICDGPVPASEFEPDTSQCVAHGTGTCNQAGPVFCTEPNNILIACNNAGNKNCLCLRTTAGSAFCAWLNGPFAYAACKKDADCVALGLPVGSACAPISEGACSGASPSGMGCFAPCPF